MKAYQLNAGGSPQRLAILRAAALKSASTGLPPGDWRGARHYTLRSYGWAHGELSQGSNDGRPVWYSMTGEYFRNERDAHSIARLDHIGWYTDDFQEETVIGIVASLPHGRFLAGYRLTMNDERVYFGHVHDDERGAALMADEHARVIAEREREYAERFTAAQRIADRIEEAESKLDELRAEHTGEIAARSMAEHAVTRAAAAIRAADIRKKVADLIVDLRRDRETLATEYEGVL